MRHHEGRLFGRGDQDLRQLGDGLVVDDAGGDGLANDLLDHGDAVAALDAALLLPAQDDRAVDEHDALDFRFQSCLDELVQAAGQPLPRVRAARRGGDSSRGQIALDLFEHRVEQLGFVGEVVVERAAGTDAGRFDEMSDAGVEKSLVDEQPSARVDECAAGLVPPGPSIVLGAASSSHVAMLATFILYVGDMADQGVRAYGTVAPLKVGLLNDYPTRADADDDTVDALTLVFEEALTAGVIDRPIELVRRNAVGLPNGTYHAVEKAYDELVAEGCLVIFGPYVSDNAVPLTAHANRVAEVANIVLSGSEGALGEWTFALNNGSMPEESRMLAAIMRGDGHGRVAVAYEASLIGKEYLIHADRAYGEAGLTVTATVPIPQVEADKLEAVRRLRAAEPDAVVHVGFGHGLWGFNDALAAEGWDPPRYTTTAFEMAHIDDVWLRQLAGWIGLDSYDERNPVGQAFLERFESRYGRRRDYFMPGLCRDVATVIVLGLAGARPLTGAGVKDAMEDIKLVPSASGAPGTCIRFGQFIRQGWMGVDYLVARRVLPDASAHVFHAAPSQYLSRVAVG